MAGIVKERKEYTRIGMERGVIVPSGRGRLGARPSYVSIMFHLPGAVSDTRLIR